MNQEDNDETDRDPAAEMPHEPINLSGWLNQVARDPQAASACRLAIVVGCHLMNGQVSPSVQELAIQTGCTPRGVGKQRAKLIAAGHLRVDRGKGRGRRNRYHLIVKSRTRLSAPCNQFQNPKT